MTHGDFLQADYALCDRLYHLPFLPTSPTAVERDCLHRIRYAMREHYLYREGGIYEPALYEEPAS